MTVETVLNVSYSKKSIQNDSNILLVSWWGTDLYFNNEQIQIGDIEIITSAYGSSGSFWSRVRSKSIGHKIHTGRRSNLRSKPTTIHGPVHISDFNYSYSRNHFSGSPQEVSKK